jgi:hypothetical protein
MCEAAPNIDCVISMVLAPVAAARRAAGNAYDLLNTFALNGTAQLNVRGLEGDLFPAFVAATPHLSSRDGHGDALRCRTQLNDLLELSGRDCDIAVDAHIEVLALSAEKINLLFHRMEVGVMVIRLPVCVDVYKIVGNQSLERVQITGNKCAATFVFQADNIVRHCFVVHFFTSANHVLLCAARRPYDARFL